MLNSESGDKSIYDPCPAGWRVPPQDIFTKVSTTGDNTNIESQYNKIGSFLNGWNFTFGKSKGYYFPAAGRMDNINKGAYHRSGFYGNYWVSDQHSIVSQSANFYFGNEYLITFSNNSRAYGCSVRCIKESITNTIPANPIDLTPKGSETANSYIVLESGKAYSFNATVMGNGATTPAATGNAVGWKIEPSLIKPVSAKVLWETAKSNSINLPWEIGLDGGVIHFKSVVLANDRVYFTTGNASEGNAVIAVYDGPNGTGNILWSWHIWKTVNDPTSVGVFSISNSSNTRTYQVMNRNLGAANAIPGDVGSIGLLYQWGRKDPFPGMVGFETNSAQATTMSNGNPNGSPQVEGAQTVMFSVKNPTIFITNSILPHDWNVSQEDNLWGNPNNNTITPNNEIGSKSIYDPCPPGWRTPPQDAFTKANTLGSDWKYEYSFNFGTTSGFYFPCVGLRNHNDGHFLGSGTDSYYWSSSQFAGTRYGGCLHFVRDNVYQFHYTGRGNCFGIRCVKN